MAEAAWRLGSRRCIPAARHSCAGLPAPSSLPAPAAPAPSKPPAAPAGACARPAGRTHLCEELSGAVGGAHQGPGGDVAEAHLALAKLAPARGGGDGVCLGHGAGSGGGGPLAGGLPTGRRRCPVRSPAASQAQAGATAAAGWVRSHQCSNFLGVTYSATGRWWGVGCRSKRAGGQQARAGGRAGGQGRGAALPGTRHPFRAHPAAAAAAGTCRYWPSVRMSTPASFRSTMASMISSSVSPAGWAAHACSAGGWV